MLALPKGNVILRFRTEARFAVGSRHSKKSCIWKVITRNDEAYIVPYMFGSDAKVSLHSSGNGSWSCTDKWVKRTGALTNAERHMRKWQSPVPNSNIAVLLFKVQIPASEIRLYEPPLNKKKVFWIDGVPEGSTVSVIFYRTSFSEFDPTDNSDLPHKHLFSLRFGNGKWLVVCIDLIEIPEVDLERLRDAVKFTVPSDRLGFQRSDLRACAFIEGELGQPPGLIELALS